MWTAPPIDAGADIDAALHLIAQRVADEEDLEPPQKKARTKAEEDAHYREEARLLFADDVEAEEEEDAAHLAPHERFERAHARLLSAPPPPAGLHVDAPSLDVRMARERLGHDPLASHIAGRPWTALEWRAYGATHSYGAVRARVEQTHARLADGRGVLRFRLDASDTGGALLVADVLPDTLARRALRDVRFLTHRANSKPDAPLTAAPFLDAWLCDPRARTYADIVFDPRHPHGDLRLPPCAPGAPPALLLWNTWPGLRAARLPPSAAGGDERAALLAPVLEHLRDVVCDGHAEHADWLLDYFAAIVQRPWRRTGVAVLLTGAQGAGKNTLLDFLRERVLGAGVTSHLHDVRHALCGRFAEGADRVVLCQVDEAWFGRHQDAEHVKHLVTGARVRVERKFQAPEHRPNYVNLVATTNSPDAGLPVGGDRRWTFFRVSRRRVGDRAYFARLHAACADDAVARAFYEALLARPNVDARFGPADDATADGQAARPLTAHYLACRRAALPPARRFLSALINARAYCPSDDTPGQGPALAAVRAADLYQDYVRYLADAGLGRAVSFVAFGLDLGQLMEPAPAAPQPAEPPAERAEEDAPKKKKRRRGERAVIEAGAALDRLRRGDGYHYRFHYGRLRALLADEYDPDAFLLRPPAGAAPF